MAKNKGKGLSARSQRIIQEKRAAARALREAGLLSRKQGRITNQYLQESSYFRKLRREFADVISGSAKAVKVPRIQIPQFKSAGFRIHKGRVVVSNDIKRPLSSVTRPPPTPPRAPRKSGSFQDCIRKILQWFDANGGSEDRAVELAMYAQQMPDVFRAIVAASNLQGERYLAGQRPVSNPWPEGVQAELFQSLYPELYYYHPSEYAHNVSGGLIPKC